MNVSFAIFASENKRLAGSDVPAPITVNFHGAKRNRRTNQRAAASSAAHDRYQALADIKRWQALRCTRYIAWCLRALFFFSAFELMPVV